MVIKYYTSELKGYKESKIIIYIYKYIYNRKKIVYNFKFYF